MKFPYQRLSKYIWRPIIPIKLLKDRVAINYDVLVDSGADMNFFDAEIAEALGIDLKTGVKGHVSGVVQGQSSEYYIHPVTISIGGWEHETSAAFMVNLSKNGHGLLGQTGFFEFFSVTFNLKKKEIEVR